MRATICMLLLLTIPLPVAAEIGSRYDVVVYGATPAGIAAALAAGKSGRTVLLLEPTERIGGLTASGLSHSDYHSYESLTGTFLDFARRVERYYERTYGPDSPQVADSFRGTHGEPGVNLRVFLSMLAEHDAITVATGRRLKAVSVADRNERRHVESAEFVTSDGQGSVIRGKVFVDGTYEGDLMAAAGVPWRAGREGRDEYGESLAPEKPDDQLQAYNLRCIMTRRPENRVTPVAPDGYRREDFVSVLDALQTDRVQKIFDYPKNCIFKAHEPRLPNGKHDINDVSSGLIRLSLPGINRDWPDGDAAARARIYAEHVRDQVGLLYFLQNDPAVPIRFREEARQWGWCRDEFADSAHLPPKLYVREARRMVGAHVFTQGDSAYAGDDARAVLHRDAIASADYGNNCHGTAHEGPRFGGKHTGEFYNPVPPYQIPYGVLLPREIDNLLVPVAASSSHVGFCALRLEPVWTSLGQAAGHAAALAIENALPVQEVDVPTLQRRLHTDGAATIYTTDVPPTSEDFAAVQWWGTAGGLHGLAKKSGNRGQRGRSIISQYTEAAIDHAAELDRPLTPALRAQWIDLAAGLGLPTSDLPQADGETTRGAFIRAAWRAHGSR